VVREVGVVRTEPRVTVATVVTDEYDDREKRKIKGKWGLATAVAVVLIATALTLGTTWHLAEKAKHGVEKGIERVENVFPKGKEKLFGTSEIPSWKWYGRHEALQKLRDALGVESGEEIDAEDCERLEELLRLDRYSHSPGFWQDLKEKWGSPSDVVKKVKSATGMGHSESFREALGLDSEPGFGQHTLAKLKEILGVEEGKPLGQETLDKLKELLGKEPKDPSFWQKTKAKAKATLHMGERGVEKAAEKAEDLEESFMDKAKDKMDQVKDKMDKVKDKIKDSVEAVKDKVMGEDSEELIREAKDRTTEAEELLEKATDARRREKKRATGGR